MSNNWDLGDAEQGRILGNIIGISGWLAFGEVHHSNKFAEKQGLVARVFIGNLAELGTMELKGIGIQ